MLTGIVLVATVLVPLLNTEGIILHVDKEVMSLVGDVTTAVGEI